MFHVVRLLGIASRRPEELLAEKEAMPPTGPQRGRGPRSQRQQHLQQVKDGNVTRPSMQAPAGAEHAVAGAPGASKDEELRAALAKIASLEQQVLHLSPMPRGEEVALQALNAVALS